MQHLPAIALLLLILCATVDAAASAVLLTVAWVLHRRQLREAIAVGEPPPPAATGQFVMIGVVGLIGLLLLYGAVWLLLR